MGLRSKKSFRSFRPPLARVFESTRNSIASASFSFLVLAVFLIFVLCTGGGSRLEITSLVLLRPVAVIVFFCGLITLQRGHVLSHRFLFGMAIMIILVVLLYLVPLPPSIWMAISGRDLIIDIDRAVAIEGVWRPSSMAPDLTWNAFYALFVPLAVLVHGVQLSEHELKRLIVLLIAAAIASSLLALLQLLGPEDGPLYLYEKTNNGAAVGFFANRNHQALFLASALPMLAAYSAPRGHPVEDRRRLFLCVALSLFILPLLLVTGSRAGLIVGALGLLSQPLIYCTGVRSSSRRAIKRQRVVWLGALSIGATVAAVTIGVIAAGRAESVRRFAGSIPEQELRYEKWAIVIDRLTQFMPLGSGPGSYIPVFKSIEPAEVLTSSYSNHAHNDWLEVLFTVGVPGGLLLGAAVAAFAIALWKQFGRSSADAARAYGWAGLLIIFMVAIASAVDYPLRTPMASALLVIACLWAGLRHGSSDIQPGVTDSSAGHERNRSENV